MASASALSNIYKPINYYRRRQLLLVSERALYLESCPKRQPDDPTAFVSALGISGIMCDRHNMYAPPCVDQYIVLYIGWHGRPP